MTHAIPIKRQGTAHPGPHDKALPNPFPIPFHRACLLRVPQLRSFPRLRFRSPSLPQVQHNLYTHHMEDATRRGHIPPFGNWDNCEELPITQYFESASQAGLLRGGGGLGGGHLYPPPVPHYYYYGQDAEEDLFKVPAPPPVVVTAYHRKVRKGTTLEKQPKQQKQRKQQLHQVKQTGAQQPKEGRVCDCDCDCDVTTQQPPRKPKVPKAVDEDLYKIPPELLRQKPRRKKTLVSEFLSRCLGLNCIP